MCCIDGSCSHCISYNLERQEARRRADAIRCENVVNMRTPELVREFAASRVRDAVNATGPTTLQHKRHCAVVDELRKRGALD